MRTAKAAIYTGANSRFEVVEFPIMPPKAGLAGLKLIASGICGTDLHIHSGRLCFTPPLVIGHEFVGKVDSICDSDAEKYDIYVGDNAIVCIACPCGKCKLCMDGDDANCVNMGVTNGGNPYTEPHFWGGYGEYNFSPVKNLIKLPADIDPLMACVFACAGPTALHAFGLAAQAGIDCGKLRTAVIQGLGPVGCFSVMYLKSLGVKNIITVTGRENAERAELARRLGASHILSLEKNGIDEIRALTDELTDSLGADICIEASGNPQAIPQAFDLLRNRGVYLVPGQYSDSGTVAIAPQTITFKALQIFGSSQYSLCDVKKYIEFLSNNRQLHGLIAELATAYGVSEINSAMADAKAGKNIKTILVSKQNIEET